MNKTSITFLIKSILAFINNEIENIRNQYNNYNNEAEIGDTIYYFDNKHVIKGKIVDKDYCKNDNSTLVYYWVVPKNKFYIAFESLKYHYLTLFKKNYVPSKIFFTHKVLFGNDIFKTADEAELARLLYNCQFYLNELLLSFNSNN